MNAAAKLRKYQEQINSAPLKTTSDMIYDTDLIDGAEFIAEAEKCVLSEEARDLV